VCKLGEMDYSDYRPSSFTVQYLLFALLLVCLCAGCGDAHDTQPPLAGRATPTATPTPEPTLEPLEIHADADWVRDRAGRVVILRGANYSGLEFGNFIGNPHGPEESDFAQMASWGFNIVRLPIAWSYIEPAPNQLSDRYLVEQVDPVIGWAAQHGILVVPEMHQFQWSACFTNGNGAPAWVCDGHMYSDDRNGQLQAGCDFFQGALAPDGRTLMDHFVDLWGFVAHHYAGDARVAGFDFFNEPIAFTCIPGGIFERRTLDPFYRRIRAAVQAAGAAQAFFFCPSITRNVGLPTVIEPFGPNVVYAPHLYTETGGDPTLAYDGNAATIMADYALGLQEAARLGGPLFAGEFGGNVDIPGGFRAATEQFLRDSLDEQDRRLVGGAVWAYFPSDNTFSVVDADGNEKGDLVDILARPYARRIAGVPTAMRFDADSKEFTFSFRNDDALAPPDPTEIFLPASRHYPQGFAVDLTAGDRWEYDAPASRILLYRGAADTHSLRITALP
jgi:endoglycosylceramidase